ncbi:hypothetical protein K3M67_20310 (plasmid) [Sphingobium sp. V4]|uniref:hypothetical protein n=1 Tax=Sphingobium sp. V4 TaxID=3038927 RepID=UPI002557CA28|nr:hypothetical protein [Sphingobium sp. V4]WIW90375.1 hypothetical protein K3M67_20310 [Sphingobium sp. V4]
MQTALQTPASIRSHAPDVLLEFGEGQWFVAVRIGGPQPCFTQARQEPGFGSHEQAVTAALAHAQAHGLSVPSREEMIDDVLETLRWFEADKMGFAA